MAKTLTLAALVTALLAGCASHWESSERATPMTYTAPESRADRGVGNLRRLLVLPAVHSYTPFMPGVTLPASQERSAQIMAPRLEGVAVRHLSNVKGYEAVHWQAPDREAGKSFTAQELNALSESLVSWPVFGSRAGGDERALIERIGRAFHVDGMLVIRSVYSDSLFSPGLMMFGVGRPGLRVEGGIYETATGRIMWQGAFWQGGSSDGHSEIRGMFRDLENAIPAILVQ